MRVVQIAALAQDRTIGDEGRLPWSYPEDLQHFKRATQGTALLMGRTTFESIGRVLPGRPNIVLTRSPGEVAAAWPGVHAGASYHDAIEVARQLNCEVLSVVGGAQVYTLTLREASELVLTFVPEVGGGDTLFPIEEWAELTPETAEQETSRRLNQMRVAIALLRYELDAHSKQEVVTLARGLFESVIETLDQATEQCEAAASGAGRAAHNH